MGRLIKISLVILGGLIALYLILIALTITFVHPDTYKTWLTKAAYEKTGRKITIAGNIKLSLFPWIGLHVGKLEVNNPPKFIAPQSAPYFATVGQADVKIAIWPLFKGHVEIKQLLLNHVTLNLVQTPSGKTNWRDLTQPTPKKPNASAAAADENFGLPMIVITHANINRIDQQNNTLTQLKNLHFRSQLNHKTQGDKIQMGFTFKRNRPSITLSVNANTMAALNFNQAQYQLTKLTVDGSILQLNHSLKMPIPYKLKGDIILNLKQQKINVKSFNANLANIKMTGSLTGKQILQTPLFQGKLNIEKFNPISFLALFNIKPNISNNALLSAAAKLNFTASDKFIKVPQLLLALDKTHLTGSLSYANFTRPDIDFTLQANQLNLDNYLLPKKTNTKPNISSKPEAFFPIKQLKKIAWDGTLKIKQLTYHKALLHNLLVNTTNNRESIKIKPFKFLINQGNATNFLTINLGSSTQNEPSINAKITAKNLPLEQTMQLLSAKQKIKGTINFNASLKTQGNEMASWLNHMAGTGKLSITHGSLLGINVNQYIGPALVLLGIKTPATQANQKNTPFESLTGNFTITNGLLKNYNLQLLANQINATGKGTINLADKTIQYRLLATYDGNKKISIPIILSGNLLKPKIVPDLQAISAELLKSKVKQNLGDRMGKILNNSINLNKLLK